MNLTLAALFLILSVIIGGVIVTSLHKLNQKEITKILLSVSGGFLLALAFVHLIPEIYENNSETIGFYVLLGFLFQLFLEYFSGGIEHGHVHGKNLKGSIPWGLFIALSIHSFFEAIPIEHQLIHGSVEHFHNHFHGEDSSALLIGVILHKIPVAIALMTLLLASGFTKKKAWIVLIIFSLMAPLGLLAGHYGSKILNLNLEIILAIVVGMFLHISTTIVFESSDNHKFNYVKLISILVGVGLALMSI
ncbi:MAG: ZIP family metal transporter [Brumimicrobium sp.]